MLLLLQWRVVTPQCVQGGVSATPPVCVVVSRNNEWYILLYCLVFSSMLYLQLCCRLSTDYTVRVVVTTARAKSCCAVPRSSAARTGPTFRLAAQTSTGSTSTQYLQYFFYLRSDTLFISQLHWLYTAAVYYCWMQRATYVE